MDPLVKTVITVGLAMLASYILFLNRRGPAALKWALLALGALLAAALR